jgi:rubredoxin
MGGKKGGEKMSDEQKCPECGHELKILLFLGVEPDGFVCEICKVWFDPENLKPLAKVLGESEIAETGEKVTVYADKDGLLTI